MTPKEIEKQLRENHRVLKMKDIEPNKGQIEGVNANPRKIDKAKLEKLIANIEKYPDMLAVRGLLVYPHNGKYVIIGAIMRYHALKKLGKKDVPCTIIPESTPVENLNAFIILDNNSFGEWDWDLLANEWSASDLDFWGVDVWQEESDSEQAAAPSEEATEDDFDEDADQVEKRVQPGDVWLCGDHRLMCGDSTSPTDMARLMNGNMADLWITDPPYNVDYAEKERFKKDMGYGSTIHETEIANDKMGNSEFRDFLVKAYSTANDVMRAGCTFYIWHADTEGINFRSALLDVGLKLSEVLIWNKNNMVFGRQDYHWKHEPCLFGWKLGASHNWYSDRSQTTVLDFDRPQVAKEHPTMKPVPLFGYQIGNSSKPGDNVLDSFGGSGTTMIACEQMGRKAYLMELTPHYCDVIIARWEKLTGKKATKEE